MLPVTEPIWAYAGVSAIPLYLPPPLLRTSYVNMALAWAGMESMTESLSDSFTPSSVQKSIRIVVFVMGEPRLFRTVTDIGSKCCSENSLGDAFHVNRS